ncbi:MAG: aspartate carbamoyltransferase regulatory subunit [Eubacteriaceae bacterium]|jgi:aspartate carbamoyltransferase regulatory subunit|nr:aspartate carbamoyltransferase regulatory subunit [Eubacteriaceae bacterium]
MINVSKLKKGIVIDHIEAGHGYKIFSQLGLDALEDVVVLMRNVPSRKMGKKDLIKIETDIHLDLTVLGLIDPNVTINFVKDGALIRKEKLQLPAVVEGILECKNPRCISKYQKINDIKFYLIDEKTKEYRCEYCDTATSF